MWRNPPLQPDIITSIDWMCYPTQRRATGRVSDHGSSTRENISETPRCVTEGESIPMKPQVPQCITKHKVPVLLNLCKQTQTSKISSNPVRNAHRKEATQLLWCQETISGPILHNRKATMRGVKTPQNTKPHPYVARQRYG
ncbi:hypothetical protein V6N13_139923 [Hibiscus sabdariffa]